MGEIAEMMLNGTLCEACGEYIQQSEAQGYPRYCSKRCANSRGVEFFKEEDEDDEDQPLSFKELKTEIKINIEMLEDNANDLKKFNSHKSNTLKDLVKNLNIFLEGLN